MSISKFGKQTSIVTVSNKIKPLYPAIIQIVKNLSVSQFFKPVPLAPFLRYGNKETIMRIKLILLVIAAFIVVSGFLA